MKIRTNMRGSWGSTVTTSSGTVEFSKEGLADVEESVGLKLIENFPNHYYEADAEDPKLTAHKEKIMAENADKIATPVEEDSPIKTASFDNTVIDEVVASVKEGDITDPGVDKVEEVEKTLSLEEELSTLKHGEIKTMLIDSGFDEDELKTYKSKDAILAYALEKLK